MKRICKGVLLLVTLQLHAWDWFEKNIAKPIEQKVIKPIEQKVVKPIEQKVVAPIKKEIDKATQALQDPGKVAVDASKQALQTVGINIDGITAQVNTIQSLLPRTQRDIQEIKNAINASNSPIKKGPVITNAISQFQAKADEVIKQVALPDVKSALSGMSALGTILQKLTTNTMQTSLRDLYSSYNNVLQEIDSVELNALLRAGQTLLIDMATTLDSCLKIRDYAGSLSQTIISNDIASAIGNMSASLRAIAGDLGKIMQGGVRKLQSVQPELANSLISNLGNINRLVTSIQATINSVPPQIDQIMANINRMNTAKDQLVATATNMPKRLEQRVLDKVRSITGVFDVPNVAVNTLRRMIMDLRNEIHVILRSARDAIAVVADIILTGVNGIEAFKAHINFDIVPPQSRDGLSTLPGDVRRLSSSIEQLRRALP